MENSDPKSDSHPEALPRWTRDRGRRAACGVRVASNYTVGSNTVDYELTDSASTLAMLLDWIEEAPIEEISVV